MKITKTVVDNHEAVNGRPKILWDSGIRGFGLIGHPSGRKVFVVQYRNKSGRTRRLTLGIYGPVLTPDRARRLAVEALLAVRSGRDPAEERQRARAAHTLKEYAEAFLEDHAAKKKPATAREYRRILEKYALPTLGTRQLGDVTLADVTRLHNAMRETPYEANRTVATLSVLFGHAEKRGEIPRGSNPARGITRFREAKRERFLSPEELARLGDALAALAKEEGTSGTVWAAVIRLLVLTGCRRSEMINLTWGEVDLPGRMLRLRDTKTGPRTLPLNPASIEILNSQPRLGGRVFHTVSVGSAARVWAGVRERAGLQGVRLHDLRHSFASVGAASGLSLLVIGKLLGHVLPSTTARYTHLHDDPVRAGTDAIGAMIAAALDGRPDPADPLVQAPFRHGPLF